MIFGFETESLNDQDFRTFQNFLKETNKRFQNPEMFKNPFKNAMIKDLVPPEHYVLYLEHQYIDPSIIIGIISIFANFFLSKWISIPIFIIFVFCALLFSKYGIYQGLKIGAKKKGFKGRIKMIKQKDLPKLLFEGL